MKALANSLLAVVLLGALLWGNCLSCPQLLLSLASRSAAHGCCPPTGKTPVPTNNDCQSFGLKHFVKTDATPQLRLPQSALAEIVVAVARNLPVAAGRAALTVPYSPPDLEVLNSSIRI